MKLTTILTYLTTISIVLADETPNKEQTEEKETSTGKIITVDSEDIEMNAAIKKAQDTFSSQFLKMTNDEAMQDRISMAMLKVRFVIPQDDEAKKKSDDKTTKQNTPEDDEQAEHMWVNDVTYDGKIITGTLASQAHDKRLPKLNSKVTFAVDDISDWLIVKDDIAVGAFSVQLLRSRMSKEKRAEHDGHYPFSFEKKEAPTKKE